MQSNRLRQPAGFWLVTGAAILWGTIGVATQGIYHLDDTTSLFINLSRMIIATPLMVAGAWAVMGRQLFHIRQRDLLLMMLSGGLLALSHATYFAAIRQVGVTVATLLTICIAPLVVTSTSVWLRLERFQFRTMVALGCALAGSVLLIGIPSHTTADARNLPVGTALSLVAAMGLGGMMICGRILADRYHPLQVTAVNFTTGTVALLLVNLLNGVVAVQTTQGWLLILYLGLVPTACAYWMFQIGLRSISASTASIVSMIDPLVAALLAWGFFGEGLSYAGMVGAALLLGSMSLLSLSSDGDADGVAR